MPPAQSPSSTGPLLQLLSQHQVVVCAGPGGVGKTTTAAALGLSGAERGMRVIALTVDPSERLLDALGVSGDRDAPERVDLARLGLSSRGRLDVATLDPARTLQELVERHTSSQQAKRIAESRMYSTLSEQLAGLHEYMALERLLSLSEADDYDVLVLDTPPASEALDFLEAPERMVAALNSPVCRWLMRSGGDKASLGARLISRSVSRALETMGALTGAELLRQLATFISDMDQVLGGIQSRAQTVSELLVGPRVGFLVVASPDADGIAQTKKLMAALRHRRLGLKSLVANRVEPDWPTATSSQITEALLEATALDTAEAREMSEVLSRLADGSRERQRQQAQSVAELQSLSDEYNVTLTQVPRIDGNGDDPTGLLQLVRHLEQQR